MIGETIEEALRARRRARGRGLPLLVRHAGRGGADAQRTPSATSTPTQRRSTPSGARSAGRGVVAGPGISVKLSALHPRYERAQRERVLRELMPRLLALAAARTADIGFNIDAEEADRLELSLDLLERLCAEPALAGWNGLGFAVQAYQKRAPPRDRLARRPARGAAAAG